MPTFSQSQPRSISTAVASLLSSSPNLSADDMIKLDTLATNANYRDALAEKARVEMEAKRAAMAFRANPANVQEAARLNAGVSPSIGEQVRQHVYGQTPVQGPVREGVDAPLGMDAGPVPPGVTPSALDRYRSTISANLLAQLGEGNDNVQQITGAMGNLQSQGRRGRIEDTRNQLDRNSILQAEAPGSARYVTNAQGVTTAPAGTTEVTGPGLNKAITDRTIAQGALAEARAAAARAQGGASSATARLRDAQTGQVGQPRPTTPRQPTVRTPEQTSADAALARERAAKAEEQELKVRKQHEADAKSYLRQRVRAKDPKFSEKDRVGQWDPGRKAFEHLDENGNVKGWLQP